MLVKFAKTLGYIISGFLDYDFPISMGPLERLNNKIKTMKMQAYEFHDQVLFNSKSWLFINQRTF